MAEKETQANKTANVAETIHDRIKKLHRWDPQVCKTPACKLTGEVERILPSMHLCSDGLYVRYEDVVAMARELFGTPK
jgi:hypothetical protein